MVTKVECKDKRKEGEQRSFACLCVIVLCMNGIEEQQEEGNIMLERQTKGDKESTKK